MFLRLINQEVLELTDKCLKFLALSLSSDDVADKLLDYKITFKVTIVRSFVFSIIPNDFILD